MFYHIAKHALAAMARLVLKRYEPRIVAITGSVGKTSARQAIVAVLGTRLRVRGAVKNYNNEFGVPCTILGVETPGKSLFAWLRVCLRALALAFGPRQQFPEILVLEMGTDHSGDIAHLLSFVKPDVGVLTAVSQAHTEFFGSVESVLAEKKLILTSLTENDFAVFNEDDMSVRLAASESIVQKIGYGFSESAMIRCHEAVVRYNDVGESVGIECELSIAGATISIFLKGIVGTHALYAPMAGAAVGLSFGMSPETIAAGLNNTQPPPSRMRLIPGIKKTLLIDDTYNSSPTAAKEAVETLAKIKSSGQKIAALGDMLELGVLTENEHKKIGLLVAENKIDILVTVGHAAQLIAVGARDAGMPDNEIFSFAKPEEAGIFLQDRIHDGDIILVKGSQGIRCEKIVKELMAEPERAEELIVRQGKEWLEK